MERMGENGWGGIFQVCFLLLFGYGAMTYKPSNKSGKQGKRAKHSR